MLFFKKDIPVELLNSSGIYKIVNMINGKVYIGKTINFRKRYTNYKCKFKNQDVRGINEYFLNSINKHGAENFKFSVVEVCSPSDAAERELYWMDQYDSLNPKKGYNLRRDSSTGLIVDQRTRDKISERIKKEYAEGVRNAKDVSDFFSNFWKNNPCVKENMKASVSKARMSYFLQSSLEGQPITLWEGINQIIENNKGFKFQNIYAACNGSKKSYRGYRWQRFDCLPDEYAHLLSDKTFSYGSARHKQELGIFEMDNSPHKATYIYKLYCKEYKFVLLYKDLGRMTSTISSALCKKCSDEVCVKGFVVKRERFNESLADWSFFQSEAERFKVFNNSEETEN